MFLGIFWAECSFSAFTFAELEKIKSLPLSSLIARASTQQEPITNESDIVDFLNKTLQTGASAPQTGPLLKIFLYVSTVTQSQSMPGYSSFPDLQAFITAVAARNPSFTPPTVQTGEIIPPLPSPTTFTLADLNVWKRFSCSQIARLAFGEGSSPFLSMVNTQYLADQMTHSWVPRDSGSDPQHGFVVLLLQSQAIPNTNYPSGYSFPTLDAFSDAVYVVAWN